MDDRRHDGSVCRRVTSELVRHQSPGLTALALEKLAKESLGRTAIAPWLDENIDEIAILIDGTPQILAPAADGDEDLVVCQYSAGPKPQRFRGGRVSGRHRPKCLILRPDGIMARDRIYKDAAGGSEASLSTRKAESARLLRGANDLKHRVVCQYSASRNGSNIGPLQAAIVVRRSLLLATRSAGAPRGLASAPPARWVHSAAECLILKADGIMARDNREA